MLGNYIGGKFEATNLLVSFQACAFTYSLLWNRAREMEPVREAETRSLGVWEWEMSVIGLGAVALCLSGRD